jgi:hypothetical protein
MARNRRDTDDDAFDANGVLRDGRSTRISSTLRDAASDGRSMFDASLHKPGHRFASTTADGIVKITVSDARQRSYNDYEATMSSAWKRTADAEGRPGAACTVRNYQYRDFFGAPGHIDDSGICVPDDLGDDETADSQRDARRDSKETMDELYLQRDREQSEAWKSRT